MNFKRNLAASLLVALILLSSGCIRVDAGVTKPTVGKQLMDLSRAKALGDLSEEEFHQLRKKVLAAF